MIAKLRKLCLVLSTTVLLCATLTSVFTHAHAQTPVTPDPTQELRRQQERERSLREAQETRPDVRLPAPEAKPNLRIPLDEKPCFPIQKVTLHSFNVEDVKDFGWLMDYASSVDATRTPFLNARMDSNFDPPVGKCLGVDGVNIVLTRMQNQLIAKGYTTSRVLAPQQDLKSGELRLQLLIGRIRDIHYTSDAKAGAPSYPAQPDPKPSLGTALPMAQGDILNLRDIEMSLENFKRVPTADVDIQIQPSKDASAQLGESDLIIKHQQKSPYRRSVSWNDSGGSSTGKYQGSATLSLDQTFWANDLFYVTLNGDAFNDEFRGKDPHPRATQGYIFHYSIPLGYWALETTLSRNAYFQTVIGATQNYIYSGTSNNNEIKLSRLFYRDATIKSTVSLKGWQRKSNNFIDDAEVVVQRRTVGGWDLGVNYRQTFGQSSLDSTWTYRQGTKAFDAQPAPEELFNEGTGRMRMVSTDTTLTHPFQVGSTKFKYSTNWRAQWDRSVLLPMDRFSIGGRSSVRGYDNASLAGEKGYFLRNDLGVTITGTQVEAYLGYDYGHVSGISSELLAGKHLAGAALGLRGRVGDAKQYWTFDIVWATPTSKPTLLKSSGKTMGFNVSYNF